MTTLDELFARPAARWSLRGDPHLWDAMRTHLRGRPVPGFLYDIGTIVERAYADLTGARLPARPDPDEAVHVPRFVTGSGMSDGAVSAHWWRYTAIPILIDRAAA